MAEGTLVKIIQQIMKKLEKGYKILNFDLISSLMSLCQSSNNAKSFRVLKAVEMGYNRNKIQRANSKVDG